MSGWGVYGVCPECGLVRKAAFGSMWYLETGLVVCPRCSTPVTKWKRRTGRKVRRGPWWSLKTEWEWTD